MAEETSDSTADQKEKRTMSAVEVPVMRIKNIRGLSAEIFSSVTPELLNCLVEVYVLKHEYQISKNPRFSGGGVR